MTEIFTSNNIQTIGTVLALFATVAGWLFDHFIVRRRRLSYRVHWNRPVDVTPAVAHGMDLSIMHGGQTVEKPSVVVLRVENVGSFDIEADDVTRPLEFGFGGRRIVHFEVQETDPAELVEEILHRGGPPPELLDHPSGTASGQLRLPRFAMARKARFKLLVLLAGEGNEVSAHGKLVGGDVVREGRRGAGSRRGLVLISLSLLFGGLLVGLVWTREPAKLQVACPAPGPLSVTGSTVLAPAIQDVAEQYMEVCPGAHIQVAGTATDMALTQLVQGGVADEELDSTEAARVKLAMADEHAGRKPRDAQLSYWPIGVAAFAVVVNRGTGMDRVTTAQLARLYAGDLPTWQDGGLGGSDQQVVLVSRATGSGTRDTFEERLLGGPEKAPVSSSDCLTKDVPGAQDQVMHCELDSTEKVLRKVAATPGAMGYASAAEAKTFEDGVDVIPVDGYLPRKDDVASGRYRFWAVEKLYRYGQVRPPTVRDHFVAYLMSQPGAIETLGRHGFFACNDPAFLAGEVAEACGQT